MTIEKNILEVENQRLKETQPEQAVAMEAEKQLIQTEKKLTEKQEENTHFAEVTAYVL